MLTMCVRTVLALILVVDFVQSQNSFTKGEQMVEITRTRLVQEIGSPKLGNQGEIGSCGTGGFCNVYEKCCNSNGIFRTCCPFQNGECCGISECCQSGQTCCAGRCCSMPNAICCHTYCCPAGNRCSGHNDNRCIPFGSDSGSVHTATACLVILQSLFMISGSMLN